MKYISYKLTFFTACVLYSNVLFSQSEKNSQIVQKNAVIERLDGQTILSEDYVGAISRVSTEKIVKYPEINIANTLQGKALGLIVRGGDGGLGVNTSSLYIRGQHTNGDNKAIVIVDGIERSIDDLVIEEIESIEILKDAVAKALYGPAAANGVIKITTKRGKIGENKISTSFEAGIMLTTREPKYLDSFNYALMYNEARINDGLTPLYSQEQLNGYKNSTGVNDLLYPNVDYMNEFLYNQSMFRKASLEFAGGNNNVKYAMVAGYIGGNGLEKLGERQNLNRFNVRGNLDIRITDYMTIKAGAAARLEIKDMGSKDAIEYYEALSTHRPNEYPFIISSEDIGMEPTEDGVPYFGTNERFNENLYADVVYGGNSSTRYMSSQADLGIDLNFKRYIPGLTAGAYLTFDNYSSTKQSLINTYATYDIRTYLDDTGERQIEYYIKRKQNLPKDNSISDNIVRRTSGWRANIGYNRNFDIHNAGINFAYRYYKMEQQNQNQDIVDANYTLRFNYGYDKRYLAETILAYMGSNRFMDDNKFFLSPTVGFSWVVSNEKFMNNLVNVNFLKLKSSFGILGYSRNTDYDLWRTAYIENGSYGSGEQNVTSNYISSFVRKGNPDLRWEKSAELNIGIEGKFLMNRLCGEVNYFNERRWDIIGQKSTSYGSYIGNFLYAENMAEVKNHGVEAYISWFDKPIKNFSYEIGFNMIYSKNKLIKTDELPNIEDYRKKIGKSTSSIMGLVAEGLFVKDVPLDGHAYQTFGPYQGGDIAYLDMNNDKIIDTRDETVIGNSFPLLSWSIDIDFRYKNWELYILGTAENGVDQLLSNTYYWNTGLGKYSEIVLNRYHDELNPDGTYPRLTSTSGANSFRNSTYWVKSGDFFRVKNIELSYTFNFKKNSVLKNLKLFARGTNLFVFSGIKKLDPERPSAGVTNYPVLSNYTGGLSMLF